MPTAISGAAELRLALRKFAPELAKENTVETILLTILDYTKQIYLLISSVLFPAYK